MQFCTTTILAATLVVLAAAKPIDTQTATETTAECTHSITTSGTSHNALVAPSPTSFATVASMTTQHPKITTAPEAELHERGIFHVSIHSSAVQALEPGLKHLGDEFKHLPGEIGKGWRSFVDSHS